jgi:hypothetical protein
MSETATIRAMDPEEKERRSIRMIGHSVSEETRQKQRAVWDRPGYREQWLGENNPAKKPEVRIKMRMAKVGTIVPETTKEKMSESHKGYIKSEDHCENLRKSSLKSWSDPKIKEARSGYGAANWKGGISFEPYCSKFNEPFKERVRIFFGRVCVNCGKTEKENGKRLAVHHANYDKMMCCNDIKPLFVAVCNSCNSKANKDREVWEEYYTRIVNEKYCGKCYLTKEEMELWNQ